MGLPTPFLPSAEVPFGGMWVVEVHATFDALRRLTGCFDDVDSDDAGMVVFRFGACSRPGLTETPKASLGPLLQKP
jgi:hypothetical protein